MGLGGAGKTHAAVEYGYRHRHKYNALLFVSGDSIQRLRSTLADLPKVLRLGTEESLPRIEAERLQMALEWLAAHDSWLLIVDNVDEEPVALALRGFFGNFTLGHVIVTSRLKSWSRQQVDSLDMQVLDETVSTDLLLKLTDIRRYKNADDFDKASALAIRMDGLPLALQQAAGYINEKRISLSQYLDRFENEAAELMTWFDRLSLSYAGPESSF